MQVNKQYVGEVSHGKPYTVQNSNEATNKDFLAALTQQIKAGQADVSALRTAMDASGYKLTDSPTLQPGVLREVTEAEKLELGLIAGGETLSAEAAQKRDELMARLNQLCARNPNVKYRMSGDIFQKMADDPAFETKIYATIDAFEQSGAAAMSVSQTSVSALYMGAMGDWVMMNSELDGEDWQSSTWQVLYGSAGSDAPTNAAEVLERFPSMDESMAQVVADNLDRDAEGEITQIIAGWQAHWEQAAAQQDYDQLFELLNRMFGAAFGGSEDDLSADTALYQLLAAGVNSTQA